jgi:GDPmannose 4,6-dehydratase
VRNHDPLSQPATSRDGAQRALVLGCNGQDGSFLVEHLLRRGYEVTGVSRQEHPRYNAGRFSYAALDLRRADALRDLLNERRPHLIFHVAAVHGEAGTRYEAIWQDMLAVNVGATHVCLEYLRTCRPQGGLLYAGSGKIFGPDYPRRMTERSRTRSSCLYTVAKNASRELIACYRRDHAIRASVLHLFNHESERRGSNFFIPTLVCALECALSSRTSSTEIDTLQFYCDWGAAEEYMDIAVDVAERALGNDMIVATGRTWWAADLARELFARHGLDYRRHLRERRTRSEGAPPYRVSVERLRSLIGRVPELEAIDVCSNMLVALHPRAQAGARH